MGRYRRFSCLAGGAWLGLTSGCGGDGSSAAPNRVETACGRIFDTVCAKWIECKVMLNGTLVTAATCAQARPQGVSGCTSSEGAGIEAATDADVDACVQGFQAFACTNLCGQIPQDPAACHKLSPDPNTTSYTCAP
jgi:hypothetical protein